MEVTLWGFDTEDSINKMWVAARTCYSKKTPQQLYKEATSVSKQKKLKLIEEILSKGHLSIIEQLNFTFLVSGVSRALSHQFMRHRHQSPAQQSQRYCKIETDFDYITPNSIRGHKELEDGYKKLMKSIADVYRILVSSGIPAEDARYILPNAATTNFTVSMNARSLIHLAHERTCVQAQLEVRALVAEMISAVCAVLPFMKQYLVSKCEWLGYCPEGDRCCGRYKTKEEVLK